MESGTELLAYERRGQGSPVVFIHGWLTGAPLWQRLLDAHAPWPYQVLLPNLRGSGPSKGTASSNLLDHARELWDTLDRAGIDTPIDVVGHSMAGAVAAWMAIEHPSRIRRLILVAPVPPSGFPLPDPVMAQFDAVGGDPVALREFLAPQVPAADVDWMVELCLSTDPQSARQTLRAWTGDSFVDRAATLPHAPLVIAGTHDPFLGPPVLRESIIQQIPGARLVEVPGGHYPMLDAPLELARLILDELGDAR